MNHVYITIGIRLEHVTFSDGASSKFFGALTPAEKEAYYNGVIAQFVTQFGQPKLDKWRSGYSANVSSSTALEHHINQQLNPLALEAHATDPSHAQRYEYYNSTRLCVHTYRILDGMSPWTLDPISLGGAWEAQVDELYVTLSYN